MICVLRHRSQRLSTLLTIPLLLTLSSLIFCAGTAVAQQKETTEDQVRTLVGELVLVGSLPESDQPQQYRRVIAEHLETVLTLAQPEPGIAGWFHALEVPMDSVALLPLKIPEPVSQVVLQASQALRELTVEQRMEVFKSISDADLIAATRQTNQLLAQVQITELPSIKAMLSSGKTEGTATPKDRKNSGKLELMRRYMDHLPPSEKRILISAYLKAPRDSSPEDKLGSVFQHVDPVLKKILQQMSFSLPDGPEKAALGKLLSKGIPFPTEQAIVIIERSLGRKIDEVFSEFDLTPKAAGSIGQVYKARLRSNHHWVAVKVLRPDAEHRSEIGIEVLIEATKNTPYATAVAQLRAALWQEFDFRNEAANMKQGQELFPDPKQLLFASGMTSGFKATKDVLISDWIPGTEADRLKIDHPEVVTEAVYRIYRRWLIVAFSTGFFHTEPHLGNIKISDPDRRKQRKTVVLDWGSSDSLTLIQRRQLLKLIVAVSLRSTEKLGSALGELANMNVEAKENLLKGIRDISLDSQEVSNSITQALAIGTEQGMEFPPELIKFIRGWSIQEDQLTELAASAHLSETKNTGAIYKEVAANLVLQEIPPQLLSRARRENAVLELDLFREVLNELVRNWFKRMGERLRFQKCVEESINSKP